MIQYFDYCDKDISSKILDIETIPDETVETLVILVNDKFQNYNIMEKCIALSGDNFNTNFVGRQRAGLNNLLLNEKKNWA